MNKLLMEAIKQDHHTGIPHNSGGYGQDLETLYTSKLVIPQTSYIRLWALETVVNPQSLILRQMCVIQLVIYLIQQSLCDMGPI